MSNVRKHQIRNLSILGFLDRCVEVEQELKAASIRADKQDKMIDKLKDDVEWLMQKFFDINEDA